MLDAGIRSSLLAAVGRLRREADVLHARLQAAETEAQLEAVRQAVVAFRGRYLLVEDVLEFYGDAVNTRTTPKLASTLRGCDELARLAMQSVLTPLGQTVPPVLTYIHKGLGASVLRAGQELWDGITLNPAAAIKKTRHNPLPTALIHEAGHQVSAQLGWDPELRRLLVAELEPIWPELALTWGSWASEIVADTFAFVHTGYGSIAGLHDVVAGDQHTVFRFTPGDPHPVAYLRVLLGTELCTRSFGIGPWNDLRRAWVLAHPLDDAPPQLHRLLQTSVRLLPEIADVCLHAPLRALHGAALTDLVDPRRVSPPELRALEQRMGLSVSTSPYWLATDALRLLALSSYRAATQTRDGGAATPDHDEWMVRLGGGLSAAA
jgi:hypothetical protein